MREEGQTNKINMKEAERFFVLIISLILALALLPLQIIIIALKAVKSTTHIIIETLTHFMELIQKEVLNK